MRTINLPLYCLVARGSGADSPFFCISMRHSLIKPRMPDNACSWVSASQLRLGNSVHSARYSWSSSDQVTRYVYRSICLAIVFLQPLNGGEHLPHLIGFGFTFSILNIYTWVTLPGCFVNTMAGARLASLSKIGIEHLA